MVLSLIDTNNTASSINEISCVLGLMVWSAVSVAFVKDLRTFQENGLDRRSRFTVREEVKLHYIASILKGDFSKKKKKELTAEDLSCSTAVFVVTPTLSFNLSFIFVVSSSCSNLAKICASAAAATAAVAILLIGTSWCDCCGRGSKIICPRTPVVTISDRSTK